MRHELKEKLINIFRRSIERGTKRNYDLEKLSNEYAEEVLSWSIMEDLLDIYYETMEYDY